MEMAHGDSKETVARSVKKLLNKVILVSNYRKLPITCESVEQFLITNFCLPSSQSHVDIKTYTLFG